jgi:hypothetical protein
MNEREGTTAINEPSRLSAERPTTSSPAPGRPAERYGQYRTRQLVLEAGVLRRFMGGAQLYKQDTYGQYNIIGEPVIPSQVEGIEYRLKAKNRQTPLESPQVLQVIVSEKALLTRFSREFEPEEIAWQEGLARIHGLLDFGFFQESNEYRWIVTSKSETDTVEPPLTLEAPDFGDDSERWISYHILSALRRARRELPREYTRKKLDPEGACAILETLKPIFVGRAKASR